MLINGALGTRISLESVTGEKCGQDKTGLRHSWALLLNPIITFNIITPCPENGIQELPSFDPNLLYPFRLSLFLLIYPIFQSHCLQVFIFSISSAYYIFSSGNHLRSALSNPSASYSTNFLNPSTALSPFQSSYALLFTNISLYMYFMSPF